MPKDLFYGLEDEKRANITGASIAEFAEYGYTNASTNRIVRRCGISKGSLFLYFESKEDLYFYILDLVTEEMTSSLSQKADALPKDLFDRVIHYAASEFAWYMEHPEKYKIIAEAFAKTDSPLYEKTAARYHQAGQSIYYKVLEGIETQSLRWDRQKTVDLLKWVLAGYQQDFISSTDMTNASMDSVQKVYIYGLTAYLELLKVGLLRETRVEGRR